MAEDAEKLIAVYTHTECPMLYPEGSEQYTKAKRRIGQLFFRDSVLAAYNDCCCITNFASRELLEACHIRPWSEDESMRTDPSNGLCLSASMHKAFDSLLISVDADLIIHVSDQFLDSCKNESLKLFFANKNGKPIIKPSRFYPHRECLEDHYHRFLISQ